jgi:hypothetical protein
VINLSAGKIGDVRVVTTNDRGMSPEEWADLALDRFVGVSATAPDPIKQQALMFKDNIKKLLLFYFNKVAEGERDTIAVLLRNHGQSELADYIYENRR